MTGATLAAPGGEGLRSLRPWWQVLALGVLGLSGIAWLVSLGTWQLERLAWKRDLIERVEQRIHAPPVEAPGPDRWPELTNAGIEYRRVTLRGRYLHDRETLVQAVTRLGPGFWVITPLLTAEGHAVLVNRGFVPTQQRDPSTRAAGQVQGEVTVTGLMRISEPRGAFLRTNDAQADRWYSRDVTAIASARGLAQVAPYFVDAEDAGLPQAPRGGLTVVAFRNQHLQYALTWFVLAAMLAGALVMVGRHEWRLRRQ